eukprot:gnl/TRDRNA2_/TRDRNA2_173825_c2_seq2.p1 gnl/TRDRNA2_/TRDRNA2_173825_c2~~gnl/TRDRNA2_/TRDRNA2_173825_c2_seq2.p1  ORF type:complete len:307 (+),score=45.25 gnl/TRDRNA2_/TRDRNA2_173825_c2_seq2:50-970(+)
MCILFVALGQHPRFPVVIAHNRDEYYSRPCAGVAPRTGRWGSEREVLAGLDLEAGGTWLGLRRVAGGSSAPSACLFATVLNLGGEKNHPITPDAPSRGTLPLRFLLSDSAHRSVAAFGKSMCNPDDVAQHMAGFVLFCATFGGAGATSFVEAVVVQNQLVPGEEAMESQQISEPGVYVICNDGKLQSDWPRVHRGRALFEELLRNSLDADGAKVMQKLLLDSFRPPERKGPGATPVFIGPGVLESPPAYGTRAATVVLLDRFGTVHVVERRFDEIEGTPSVFISTLDAMSWEPIFRGLSQSMKSRL